MIKILKKIAFFSVALAALTALAFTGYSSWKNRHLAKNQTQNQSQKSSENDDEKVLAKKDSDNDGLNDLEEKRWNTDPQNPDTDGDGYQDGKEIKAGHDPLIPAPNDKIVKDQAPESANSSQNAVSPSPNLTSTFLKQMKGQVAGENAEAAKISEDQIKQGMGGFIESQDVKIDLPYIANSELNVSYDTGKKQAEDYLAEVGNVPLNLQMSLSYQQAFEDLLKNRKTETFDALIKDLEEELNRLKEIKTPIDAVPLHKLVVGRMSVIVDLFQNIRATYRTDPIQSAISVEKLRALDQFTPQINQEETKLKAKYSLP